MSTTFSIEDIIADYTPEPEFTITLPTGEALRFRALTSHADLRNHQKAVAAWFQQIPSPMPESNPWYGIAPTCVEDAYNVFTISELSVEPKITQMDAMRMLRAPMLVEYLSEQIEAGMKSIRSRVLAASIEKAKKNSALMDSAETNSPSAEMPSENTPTN